MTEFFYDQTTDTIRAFNLTGEAGTYPKLRYCKKGKEWSPDCCEKTACKWDEVVTEAQAQTIVERQCNE